ncbi:MAG: quinolinate synthase NadA [Clostridium fessum]
MKKGEGKEMDQEIKQRIETLKKEKDAVILAHYYVDGEVQEIADYVGDSYYLAELATTVPQKTIIFCGVSFMGESAKILSPEKTVIMADRSADCPMAHMVEVEKIREVRKEYPDVAVVCYVNSMAEIKAESDVCVTSSNALKIMKKLPNKDIFFIRMRIWDVLSQKVPEKHFIFNDGFCHVRKSIHAEDVKKAKSCIRRQLCWRIRSVPAMCWSWRFCRKYLPDY